MAWAVAQAWVPRSDTGWTAAECPGVAEAKQLALGSQGSLAVSARLPEIPEGLQSQAGPQEGRPVFSRSELQSEGLAG